MKLKGVTYIETIIAITIFSLCATVLVSVYFQSIRNKEYAVQQYKASILGESVLNSVKAQLNINPTPEIKNYSLQGFLGNTVALESGFDICIAMKKIYSVGLDSNLLTISNKTDYDFTNFFGNTSVYSPNNIFDSEELPVGTQPNYLVKVDIQYNNKTVYSITDIYSFKYR